MHAAMTALVMTTVIQPPSSNFAIVVTIRMLTVTSRPVADSARRRIHFASPRCLIQ